MRLTKPLARVIDTLFHNYEAAISDGDLEAAASAEQALAFSFTILHHAHGGTPEAIINQMRACTRVSILPSRLAALMESAP
jgi:hypothetical protein